VGARKEAHLVEVLRQGGDRVRVVRDVEHVGRLARHDLEAPRQLDPGEAGADRLRAHRQAPAQRLEHGEHAGGVEELVGAAQRRIGEAAVARFPALPAPLLAVALDAEVDPGATQVGADRARLVDHALRRHRIADDRRPAAAQDARLGEADRLAVAAEVLGVVEVDARQHRAVGVEDVDRVEAAAEADLEDDEVERRRREQPGDRQEGELEVGERDVAAGRLDRFEVRQQRLGRRRSRRRSGSAPRNAPGAAWRRGRPR
jgi:hypothetical protein